LGESPCHESGATHLASPFLMSGAEVWDLHKLRQLQELVGRLSADGSLQQTLQRVVDGVVEMANFEVAAVNHRQSDGMMQCIAVAGNDAARAHLLGVRTPRAVFEAEFAVAECWDKLRFVPYNRMLTDVSPGWIPELEPTDDPQAWDPRDALFAPLNSPDGDLIGVLAVDLPKDRRRPGPFQRELLQMYAAHAGIAIYRAQLTDQLAESEQSFRLAFENAGIGMAVLSLTSDESSRYLRANQAFCNLVGYSEEQLKTMTTADITHPEDRGADLVNVHKAVTQEQRVFEVEKRYLHADGGSVWVAVTTSVIEDGKGRPVSAISQVQDIRERRALHEALSRDALNDSLTGLANRRALYNRLHTASDVEAAGRTHVLFCDLDSFKLVNDRYGHHFGDCALIAVAERLSDIIGPAGLVARLGGDEFVMLVPGADVEALAAQLIKSIAEPLPVNGREVNLTASVGIAEVVPHRTPSQAIHRADGAMYEAKRAGGNGYRIAKE